MLSISQKRKENLIEKSADTLYRILHLQIIYRIDFKEKNPLFCRKKGIFLKKYIGASPAFAKISINILIFANAKFSIQNSKYRILNYFLLSIVSILSRAYSQACNTKLEKVTS